MYDLRRPSYIWYLILPLFCLLRFFREWPEQAMQAIAIYVEDVTWTPHGPQIVINNRRRFSWGHLLRPYSHGNSLTWSLQFILVIALDFTIIVSEKTVMKVYILTSFDYQRKKTLMIWWHDTIYQNAVLKASKPDATQEWIQNQYVWMNSSSTNFIPVKSSSYSIWSVTF